MNINKKKIQRIFAKGRLSALRALRGATMLKVATLILILSSLVLLDAILVIPKNESSANLPATQDEAGKTPLKQNTTAFNKTFKNWWDDKVLSFYGESLINNIIDTEFADLLANKAVQRANKLKSKGNCLRAVKFDLWNVLSKLKGMTEFLDLNKVSFDPGKYHNRYSPGRSAENFRQWATNNPISLFTELQLADISHIPNLPLRKGYILIYAKNTNGFHRRYGHIEIVTKTGKSIEACSDHCRLIKPHQKPSMILAPVRNYAPLYTFENNKKQLGLGSI